MKSKLESRLTLRCSCVVSQTDTDVQLSRLAWRITDEIDPAANGQARKYRRIFEILQRTVQTLEQGTAEVQFRFGSGKLIDTTVIWTAQR